MSNDPYSLAYRKLWEMMETHRGFTALVKVSNRGKHIAIPRYSPEAFAILPEHRPFVTLWTGGGESHAEATSSSSFESPRYHLVIVTESIFLDDAKGLYPVAWEVYRAWLLWADVLRQLKYEDHAFIHHARLTTYGDALADPEEKGIRGWVRRWDIDMRYNFVTSQIKP